MTVTYKNLARLTSSLYGNPGAIKTDWLYRSNLDANVHMGIVRLDKFLIVVCRGSFTGEDWLHDLRFKAIVPKGNPKFGRVHEGFYYGTSEAWDIIKCYINDYKIVHDKLVFSGHSLGAARATILAQHAVQAGFKPHALVCWGEPASFYSEGVSLISDISGISYQNVVDHIPDPVTIITLPFGYLNRKPLARISVRPKETKFIDPLRLHHFEYYEQATPDIVL